MKRSLNGITLLSDAEFNRKFNAEELGHWENCFNTTYGRTCRFLELLKCWNDRLSLENTLLKMWNICFDIYFEDGIRYMPISFYNFCVETFMAFSDELDD